VTYSLAIICITNPRYTLAREYILCAAGKIWSLHYICRMFVLPICQRIFCFVFFRLVVWKRKNPLHFCKGFLYLTTKNKRLHFYCLWHNPHSVHNIILLLGG
jgi:hypothetical protein